MFCQEIDPLPRAGDLERRPTLLVEESLPPLPVYVIVIRLGRLTRGREASTVVIQGCHSRFRLAAWKVNLAHFALFSWFLLRSSRKADILGGEYPVPTSGD